MKKLLGVLLVLLVLVAGALGGLYSWLETAVSRAKAEGTSEEVEVEVPKGANGRSVGKLLADKGLIEDARVWRYHLWKRGALNAKAGRHVLKASMTMAELCAALEANPLAEDQPIKVIEGWRLRETDAALSAMGLAFTDEYTKAASDPSRFKAPFPLPTRGTLEGYLYPETYRVKETGFDVSGFIQRQLDTFAERFYSPHKEEIEKCGRTLHELVTMASLLEREEPVPAQRPLVAGILWKRLDKGFALGVDATSRYELEEWNDRKAFLVKLRDTEDPYNTRARKGLPPTPIGAATVESLLAAMRPEKSDYWYYLHDSKR
ncbi:MAG: endolytic transglycosylase MltG [Deltaproteobacteria bacterium]|nr:endolytic transglycosylase MltG [Deltaproteobacteria bacterium]